MTSLRRAVREQMRGRPVSRPRPRGTQNKHRPQKVGTPKGRPEGAPTGQGSPMAE